MRTILALDLGTNMALAHNAFGEPVACHASFAKLRRPERACLTMIWLQKVFEALETQSIQIDIVAYERPFARGQDATRSLWGIAGIIEALAHDHGARLVDFSPKEIKKAACLDGRADKDDMIFVAQLTGYTGDNEHAADAWNLLRFCETLDAAGHFDPIIKKRKPRNVRPV